VQRRIQPTVVGYDNSLSSESHCRQNVFPIFVAYGDRVRMVAKPETYEDLMDFCYEEFKITSYAPSDSGLIAVLRRKRVAAPEYTLCSIILQSTFSSIRESTDGGKRHPSGYYVAIFKYPRDNISDDELRSRI
jgi:hypothetical protein